MANPLKISLSIKAFNEALSPIKRTQQAISELGKKSDQLNVYDKVKREFNQANKTLRDARNHVRQLHQAREKDGKVTDAWRNKIQQANAQVNAAREMADKQRRTLAGLSADLKAAGLSTHNVGRQQQQIEQKIKRATFALTVQQGAAKGLSVALRAIKLPMALLGKGLVYGGLVGNTLGMIKNKVSQLLNPFVGVASRLEDFESTMQALNGTGAKSMQWLDAFARKNTTVPITQLAKAFEDLTIAGMPVEKTLQSVVDYQAGIGKSASDAGAIIDVLRTDWIRQRIGPGSSTRLQNMGVDVFGLLSRERQRTQPESTQYSAKQFADMAKQGKLGRAAMKKLIDQMQFEQAGAASKTQTSWNGLMDELSSRWQLFQKDLMDYGVFDALKEQLQRLSRWVSEQAKNGNMQKWAQDINTKLVPAIENFGNKADTLYQNLDKIFTAGKWLSSPIWGLVDLFSAADDKFISKDKGSMSVPELVAHNRKIAQQAEQQGLAAAAKMRSEASGKALQTLAQQHAQRALDQLPLNTPAQRSTAHVKIDFDGRGMPRVQTKTDDAHTTVETNVGYSLVGAY